jgi:hypothetical protein
MRKTFYVTSWLIVVIISSVGQFTMADSHCAHCGVVGPCQKLCRPVFEEKKVEVVCWGCKCEEVCVPGPSCAGCRHCETVCQSCDEAPDPSKPHSEPKKFIWTEWLPNFAQTYTRTKLMKTTVKVNVPGYKWVTEDLCSQCAARCAGESAAANGVTALPPPANNANDPLKIVR